MVDKSKIDTPVSPEIPSTVPFLTRRIKLSRWLIPVVIVVVALAFELPEHFLPGVDVQPDTPLHLIPEFLLYLLIAVGFEVVLIWLHRTLTLQENTAQKLVTSMQEAVRAKEEVNRLNVSLEKRVEERTAELAAAHDELAQKNEELRALDRMKSEFVSLVSHELRAPLTNINGGIELLLHREQDLNHRIKSTLTRLSAESQRLTALVETILDISALEAGALNLSKEVLFVDEIIHDQIEVCRSHYLNRTGLAEFTIIIEEELPPVLADKSCLANVLSSLLDNARKYSGGQITVEAHRADQKTVQITIADRGKGIPPDEQAHIFELFYRADSSDNREVYGYGVGLYASERLVKAMKGDIWVESHVGEGTKFHFTLPIAEIETNDSQNLDN